MTLKYSYCYFFSFFSGCHLFIPLFDPAYDTYEGLKERTPWTFDAILAIASKIRSGNSALSPTFYKCLEEAQGIARSSLFGPVVRKEAVQGTQALHHDVERNPCSFRYQVCSCWQHGVQTGGFLLDMRCAWRLTWGCTVHWKNLPMEAPRGARRKRNGTSVRAFTLLLTLHPSFPHLPRHERPAEHH